MKEQIGVIIATIMIVFLLAITVKTLTHNDSPLRNIKVESIK